MTQAALLQVPDQDGSCSQAWLRKLGHKVKCAQGPVVQLSAVLGCSVEHSPRGVPWEDTHCAELCSPSCRCVMFAGQYD